MSDAMGSSLEIEMSSRCARTKCTLFKVARDPLDSNTNIETTDIWVSFFSVQTKGEAHHLAHRSASACDIDIMQISLTLGSLKCQRTTPEQAASPCPVHSQSQNFWPYL